MRFLSTNFYLGSVKAIYLLSGLGSKDSKHTVLGKLNLFYSVCVCFVLTLCSCEIVVEIISVDESSLTTTYKRVTRGISVMVSAFAVISSISEKCKLKNLLTAVALIQSQVEKHTASQTESLTLKLFSLKLFIEQLVHVTLYIISHVMAFHQSTVKSGTSGTDILWDLVHMISYTYISTVHIAVAYSFKIISILLMESLKKIKADIEGTASPTLAAFTVNLPSSVFVITRSGQLFDGRVQHI